MTPSEREDLLGRHFEDALDDGAAERLDELLERDAAAFDRFRGLAEIHGLLWAREAGSDAREALGGRVMVSVGAEEPRRRLSRRVMATLQDRHRPRRVAWAPILIAAGLLLGLAGLFLFTSEKETQVVRKAPVVELPREQPAAPTPEPKQIVEAPRPTIPSPTPAPPVPAPAPERKPDPPVVAVPVPRPEPKPAPVPEPPVPAKSTPDPVRFKAIVVASVQGGISRRRDGIVELLAPGAEVARTDALLAGSRRPGRVAMRDGGTIALGRGATLALEQEEAGTLRATLSGGMAFFEAPPRPAPFIVLTPEAEIHFAGGSLQVERDEKRTSVSVLEGSARLRNEKGEVTLRAAQRSIVRGGEKPSAAAKADVEAASAWRRRPELAENPERAPFSDHETGSNRKLAGLAIAAPYFEGEPESGRLARAVAERLDAGLALGHFWRDLEKKRWINVDRAMEAEMFADGSRDREAFSDRARKATAEYLDHLRAAAGAGPREPVPMIVQFRNHYETQGGGELEVCEVAWSGWNRSTMAAAKAFYAQLLEKHKPAYRLELRFQGVDDAYDFKGQKRRFFFTEEDARVEGYMAPRHARNAAAFFVNPSFGKRLEDFDAYGKILAELIEFLYVRRR